MSSLARYPTSSDIYIEINGKRLAVAQQYKAKTTRESRYIEAFGSLEPVGTSAGKIKHILELSRISLSGTAMDDGINFHELANFNVVIVKPGRRVIYSGCEWSSIDEGVSLGTSVLESAVIVAAKRLETN